MDCQDNFEQVTFHSTGTRDVVDILYYFLSEVKIEDVEKGLDKDVDGRDSCSCLKNIPRSTTFLTSSELNERVFI